MGSTVQTMASLPHPRGVRTAWVGRAHPDPLRHDPDSMPYHHKTCSAASSEDCLEAQQFGYDVELNIRASVEVRRARIALDETMWRAWPLAPPTVVNWLVTTCRGHDNASLHPHSCTQQHTHDAPYTDPLIDATAHLGGGQEGKGYVIIWQFGHILSGGSNTHLEMSLARQRIVPLSSVHSSAHP